MGLQQLQHLLPLEQTSELGGLSDLYMLDFLVQHLNGLPKLLVVELPELLELPEKQLLMDPPFLPEDLGVLNQDLVPRLQEPPDLLLEPVLEILLEILVQTLQLRHQLLVPQS